MELTSELGIWNLSIVHNLNTCFELSNGGTCILVALVEPVWPAGEPGSRDHNSDYNVREHKRELMVSLVPGSLIYNIAHILGIGFKI